MIKASLIGVLSSAMSVVQSLQNGGASYGILGQLSILRFTVSSPEPSVFAPSECQCNNG